ncbi:carbon-nitrogen hydrolase family protein [Clostridium vitabionis]|uniref:carbon-nitrogen hydrolase family protein n=1 Tax=Clostridium vitabionis TaxID=2784388 RepID=UPI00188CD21C|nr:carbon-nitrogen hydrolase family protein [Clostridium vitabionis]
MQSTFVLAQLHSDGMPEVNLKKAEDAVERAVSLYHPGLMLFPECFMSLFPGKTDRKTRLGTAQALDGPFVTGMRTLAKKYGIWLVFGMNEKVEDPADDRNYNCSVMIDGNGEIVRTYRKTHLYDAFGYRESDEYKPGDALFEPIDTPFGRVGLFVCYEVRFPEVARFERARGADILLVPTSWVKGDLKSHQFRTLVTSRAVENGVYVAACDQCGGAQMGESVVVDPMGVPVSTAGEAEILLPAYIDTDRIAQVRKKVASYEGRRPELYGE